MTDLKDRLTFGSQLIGYRLPPMPRSHGKAARPKSPRRSWLRALRCHLRRTAIDRELAAGEDPEADECRHLRAAELTGASTRSTVAKGYERLLAGVVSPQPYGMLPVNWDGIRAAKPRIELLAKRLRDDPRVRAQGVARARLLLTERDSSLYGRHHGSRFADEVRSALALL